MRRISALLLLSLVSAALLASCLDAGKAVRNLEASAGTASKVFLVRASRSLPSKYRSRSMPATSGAL